MALDERGLRSQHSDVCRVRSDELWAVTKCAADRPNDETPLVCAEDGAQRSEEEDKHVEVQDM